MLFLKGKKMSQLCPISASQRFTLRWGERGWTDDNLDAISPIPPQYWSGGYYYHVSVLYEGEEREKEGKKKNTLRERKMEEEGSAPRWFWVVS